MIQSVTTPAQRAEFLRRIAGKPYFEAVLGTHLALFGRCPKDANGGWSRQESQILNIYAYHYWDGATAASGKTGWGDAPTKEYSELTGE